MTAITYDEGGLHLITGRCIAVDDPFHRAEEDNEVFCPPKTDVND